VILAIDTDYGKTYLQEIKKDFYGQIYSELHAKNETNYKETLMRVNDFNPEIVILATVRTNASEILKQSKELNLNLNYYSTSSSISYYFLNLTKELSNNIYFISPYNPNLNPNTKEFAQKYFDKYNEKSDMLSANAYDTLMILSNCFENKGTNVENVKNCIYNTQNYSGASGIFSFDANGDVIKPFYIYKIENNDFVLQN